MITSSPELTAHSANLAAQVGDKLDATKKAVQTTVKQVKQHVHKGSETAQAKAGQATQQVTSAANEALAKLPTAASGRVGQLAGTVRRRPVPTAAVLLGVVVLVVLRLVLRRN